MTKSFLAAKLSHFIDLTQKEGELLAGMEEATRRYPRRTTVIGQGEPSRDIYVLKSGWLYTHVGDADGGDVIAEVFHPGDVVGLGQIAFDTSPVTYTAATDAALCPFPKIGLEPLFTHHPRLIALFFALTTLERASMIDRLRAMSRMTARNCVALFLLQTRARLRLTGHAEHEAFELPLSQELIGNAIGLSNVSVNRAMRLLEAEGEIRRDGRMIRILDPERLGRDVEFNDRYYSVEADWLPRMSSVRSLTQKLDTEE